MGASDCISKFSPIHLSILCVQLWPSRSLSALLSNATGAEVEVCHFYRNRLAFHCDHEWLQNAELGLRCLNRHHVILVHSVVFHSDHIP